MTERSIYDPIPYTDYDNQTRYMPPVATQWKTDMKRKIDTLCKRYDWCTPDHFRFRAPEEFIKTGRWPEDAVRPTTISVADRREIPNV